MIEEVFGAEAKGKTMRVWQFYEQQGLRKGRQEGRQEGKQEGRKEGKQEGLLEAARKMLLAGVDAGVVSKAMGLPQRKLAALAKK